MLFQYTKTCKCLADRKNYPGTRSPLQDRRKRRQVQWHTMQSGYLGLIQPQLVVDLPTTFTESQFQLLVWKLLFPHLLQFESIHRLPIQSHPGRTEILQQTHMHSWQEPPQTLSQTDSIHTFTHIVLYCQDDFQVASETCLRAHKSKSSLVVFQRPSSTTYRLQIGRCSFPMWPS